MARLSQKSNDRVRFRCYDPGANGGGIHEWYEALPGDVQAQVDAALETLSNSRRPWPETMYEKLHGACYGLAEIRVAMPISQSETNGDGGFDQFRILVFEGPDRREVTLLYGFKKEINADYAAPCRSARQRRDGVKKDGKRAQPCAFP